MALCRVAFDGADVDHIDAAAAISAAADPVGFAFDDALELVDVGTFDPASLEATLRVVCEP